MGNSMKRRRKILMPGPPQPVSAKDYGRIQRSPQVQAAKTAGLLLPLTAGPAAKGLRGRAQPARKR